MPSTVLEGSIVALRGWEVFCLVLWLAGWVLVIRYGRTQLLIGIYAGATLCAVFWDWILGSDWFFRMTFDERFVMIYSIDGRPEPLWAPLSYGFFFGITSLLALRYRHQIDDKLGRWQFLIIPVALGLADIVVEGTTVAVLNLYVFNIQTSWLAFGVPYTNVLFVAITEFFILYCARGMGELLERAGRPPVADIARPSAVTSGPRGSGTVGVLTTTSPAVAPAPLKMSLAPLAIGLVIPAGAVYLGVIVTTLVLNVFRPW